MIEEVKRSGNKVEVVVRMDGGVGGKVEKRREVGMALEMIVGEVIGEINGLREDREELVRLESCSKYFRVKEGRSDLVIEVELMPVVRDLSKPEVKKLFELGIKRFLRKPEIDPKDYLRFGM